MMKDKTKKNNIAKKYINFEAKAPNKVHEPVEESDGSYESDFIDDEEFEYKVDNLWHDLYLTSVKMTRNLDENLQCVAQLKQYGRQMKKEEIMKAKALLIIKIINKLNRNIIQHKKLLNELKKENTKTFKYND